MRLRVLRWILAIVLLPGIFCGMAVAGVWALDLLQWLCPAELVVSGTCTACWYNPAVDGLFLGFSAVTAVLIVLLPAWVAPAYRRTFAALAFAGGAALAIHVGGKEAAAAIVGGVAALGFALARWGKRAA